MSELQLERHVRQILRDLDVLGVIAGYHTHDSRRSPSGFPDWVFAGAGGVIFRELKTARGKLTAAQVSWQRVLGAGGADAGIWRPADLMSGRIAAELAAVAGLGGAR
jgi:hypothetical protein